MFDVGFPELFIVAVLAIIVVGPRDLPKVIRSVMGMIRKVREMGAEFQTGMKKMADEVELDAVTRKLNEAGNVKIDETKPETDKSNDFSDYQEFDYDDYDYEGATDSPAPKKETSADEPATKSNDTPEPPDIVDEKSDDPVSETTEDDKPVKSKADD